MPDSPEQTPDPADWATVWQSELTALAVGLERRERGFALGRAWTKTMENLLHWCLAL